MKWLWEHIKITLSGMLMVISDAIPGFSGGIALTITNKLHEVWGTWTKIKKPKKKGDRKAGIIFYLFFIIGSVGGTFGFAQIINLMLINIPSITFWFFLSLSISSIFIYRKVNKKELFQNKEFTKASKKKKCIAAGKWMFLGGALIISITVITAITQGLQTRELLKHASNEVGFTNYKVVALLFVGGFFASAAMVTPGMSGALVLLVFGVYSQLYSGLYANVSDHPWILMIYLVGTVLGTLTSVVVLDKMFKKWPFAISWFFYGTILMSIVAMAWIFAPIFVPEDTWRWGVIVPVILLGFTLSFVTVKFIKVK